jgi:hypothetical protein
MIIERGDWMNKFKSIDPERLKDNPFKLIGKGWMLITAGTKKSFNTITGVTLIVF